MFDPSKVNHAEAPWDREAREIRRRAGDLTSVELAYDIRRRAGALTMPEEAQIIMQRVNRIMGPGF